MWDLLKTLGIAVVVVGAWLLYLLAVVVPVQRAHLGPAVKRDGLSATVWTSVLAFVQKLGLLALIVWALVKFAGGMESLRSGVGAFALFLVSFSLFHTLSAAAVMGILLGLEWRRLRRCE